MDTLNVFGLILVYLCPAETVALRTICKAFLSSFKTQFRDNLETLGEAKLLTSLGRMFHNNFPFIN